MTPGSLGYGQMDTLLGEGATPVGSLKESGAVYYQANAHFAPPPQPSLFLATSMTRVEECRLGVNKAVLYAPRTPWGALMRNVTSRSNMCIVDPPYSLSPQ